MMRDEGDFTLKQFVYVLNESDILKGGRKI